MGALDLGGDAQAEKLALLGGDATRRVARAFAPVRAGATVPASGPVLSRREVGLGKPARLAAEIIRDVGREIGQQPVVGEIVVELGVGAPIPALALVGLSHVETAGP